MKRLIYLTIIVLCWTTTYAQDLPCTGYDLLSDESYVRGSGSSIDVDSIIAKKKAVMIARQRIIQQIEVTVNSATEIYLRTITTEENTEIVSYMRSLTNVISNKLLIGSKIVCEKTIRNNNNQYESSIALEIPLEGIISLIPEKGQYQIDWNQYKELLQQQLISKP